ncbi:MAG: hypothetical protein ABS84_04130 [Rubrivivax sp. SCN 71-131]|nr:MAG: hypothetical protein ABS84_04130 [Rubrivivax sp. SCN 71-131]
MTEDARRGRAGNSPQRVDAAASRSAPRSLASPGALFGSPEFLFRRAHQLAVAAFSESCRHLDLTPSQYAVLFMLREVGDASQNELGRMVALDRSTTSVVLRSLSERRLVREHADPTDLRKKRLRLSDAGRLLLGEAERLCASSSRQLLDTLGQEKAAQLLDLLVELSNGARPQGPG